MERADSGGCWRKVEMERAFELSLTLDTEKIGVDRSMVGLLGEAEDGMSVKRILNASLHWKDGGKGEWGSCWEMWGWNKS